MNCLIIEDEKIAAERLKNLILKIEPDIHILGITQSVKKSIEWLQNNPPPNLVFIDIQLADGLSFEIFEQIDANFPVIFTTAYDEYALKAFKLNSIDYLLKPIKPDELKQAIEKYKTQHKPIEYPLHIFDGIMKNLTHKYKSKFAIKVGEHLRIINTSDVQCFFIIEKAVFLQNLEGRDYALNYSLDQLEDMLEPEEFFRINRKYIIALKAIKDIISYSNSRLLVKLQTNTDDNLVVSRERVQEFKQWLEK